MSRETLQKAVDLAGGQVHLARGVRARMAGSKIGQVHVWGWLNSVKMEVPPAECVIAICATCDWKITPHELREDIYPNPTDGIPSGKSIPKECTESCATCPSAETCVSEYECGSCDPRHGLDRRQPEPRARIDRRHEEAA